MLKLITATVLLSFGWPGVATERFLDFGEYKLNESPRGFRSIVSGDGQPGDWRIILDEVPSAMPPLIPRAGAGTKRAVLAQLSRDRTDEHFPLLIFEEDTFGDFSLTTRFKIVDGAEEQMAGIAFRLQDERNFYYIRASALGGTFSFFKMTDGNLTDTVGSKIEIPKGVWREMTIVCRGNEIRGSLDGQEKLLVTLRGDKVFSAGKIAFWTKSDSVSYFTDTRITYKPKEILAQVLVRDALKEYPRLKGLKIFAASPDQAETRVIASNDPGEIGKPAGKEEQDVIARNVVYHGKGKDTVAIVMPLHDSNGDTVAAVKVVMKPFPGQTEKNAMARALPVVKRIESRVRSLQDLIQ